MVVKKNFLCTNISFTLSQIKKYYHYFFSIQRAYGKLKENTVKFKYAEIVN